MSARWPGMMRKATAAESDFAPEYLRKRLEYDPETGILTWRLSDDQEPRWNSRWAGKPAFTTTSGGYKQGRINYRAFHAHRVIWAMHYGSWPNGSIDHINHDRADNRICNLRVVSRLENQRNQKRRIDNRAATGVSWDARRSKWCARICVNYRTKFIGYFDDMESAIRARQVASVQYGFHANHGAGNHG